MEVSETRTRTRDIKQDTFMIRTQNNEILDEIKQLQDRLGQLGLNDVMLRRFLETATESVVGSEDTLHPSDMIEEPAVQETSPSDHADSPTESVEGREDSETLKDDLSHMSTPSSSINPRLMNSDAASQWARTKLRPAECKRTDELLFRAACDKACHAKVLENLLSKGADVNAVGSIPEQILSDVYEWEGSKTGTILAILAIMDNLDGVELVLDWGADMDVKTDREETALWLASRKGNSHVVHELLSRGANPTLKP